MTAIDFFGIGIILLFISFIVLIICVVAKKRKRIPMIMLIISGFMVIASLVAYTIEDPEKAIRKRAVEAIRQDIMQNGRIGSLVYFTGKILTDPYEETGIFRRLYGINVVGFLVSTNDGSYLVRTTPEIALGFKSGQFVTVYGTIIDDEDSDVYPCVAGLVIDKAQTPEEALIEELENILQEILTK